MNYFFHYKYIMEIKNNMLTKFIYKLKLINDLEFTKNIDVKTLSFFTDGSCIGNGSVDAIGSYAAVCVSGYKKNTIIYGKLVNKLLTPTNIRAEGIAILKVLELLLQELQSKKWKCCIIYTDSEFWLKMLYNYMPTWPAAHFKLKANADITILMWDIWSQLLISKKNIQIIHVYAHNKDNRANSTDPYKKFTYDVNELVDELASTARNLTHTTNVQENIL